MSGAKYATLHHERCNISVVTIYFDEPTGTTGGSVGLWSVQCGSLLQENVYMHFQLF